MTLLEINLTDVLSETDPDDRVVVWAPAFREGPAGQLVGTRRKAIPLVDGVGSDEVVPGPLMVQVQCKAISDTSPREVVVPEEGPVTLTDLLHETFTYTPAVVNESLAQITTALDDALADVDGAVDQALAGSQHYSGTGFPEGVVAATVGAVYTDTAATAGAIRWIKTSGTGAAGWKVQYGDTGQRNITAQSTSTNGASFVLQRVGQVVTVTTSGNQFSAESEQIVSLPAGFRPPFYVYGETVKYWGQDVTRAFRVESSGAFRVRSLMATDVLNITLSWNTINPWPTTLPGVPA